jgi:hypothetical protein
MPNSAENANSVLDNFSISDTMGMGMGDQNLLEGLMAPETSTANPDNISKIIDEVPDDNIPAKTTAPKGKVVTTEDVDPNAALLNFLGDATNGEDDEEEDDEDDTPGDVISKGKAPVKQSASDDDDDEDDVQDSKFTALSRDLTKLGVFTEVEGEEPISTPEQFLQKFNDEKQRGSIEMVNNFIGQFGDDYQQAFNAIFVKGVNPKEYFGIYNQVVDYAEMDLTQENNQVKVMKQALADQGFEEEDIESEIDRLKNYGDLETVSQKHHKILVKKDTARLAQIEEDSQKELQNKAAIRNQYITNVQSILADKVKNKEFDGIPLNPKLAGELQDFLLVDKWKTASGETLSDFDRTILEMKRPENHAMKVKMALLLKLLEKDPTLSTIQRTGVTKKTDELFADVARHVTKAKTPVQKDNKPKSWFS